MQQWMEGIDTDNCRNASCICVTWLLHMCDTTFCCGVATTCRLLKIIGLFCKRALLKGRYSAKETYDFKEPTNRSHPIYDTALDRRDRHGQTQDTTAHSCVPWLLFSCTSEGVMSHIKQSCHTHTLQENTLLRSLACVWVRHDCSICVTWLLHLRDLTPSYIYDAVMDGWGRHGQLQECLISICDMTPSYMWLDSFIYIWCSNGWTG